jgi:hypothetical protein
VSTTITLDTSAALIKTGALIFRCNEPSVTRTIVRPESWDMLPSADWFVTEDANGYRTYNVFTGRTRKFWGMDCPTVERWEIDTVVVENFRGTGLSSIVGVPLRRMPGTWATRPENVSFL